MENTGKNEFLRENKRDPRQGDDTYRHDSYVFSERKNKAQFESLNLDAAFFHDYAVPRFSEEISRRIRDHRVLVVGGNYAFNKAMFLKYIAVQSRNPDQVIRECTTHNNFYGLSSAMYDETKGSIFILNYLLAKDINYRLGELRSFAKSRDHIILISTDDSYHSWHFDQGPEQDCWFEIPEHDIYSEEVLLKHLDDALKKNNVKLPGDPRSVVFKLPAVGQIDLFVEALEKKRGAIDERVVADLLDDCGHSQSGNLEQWFHSLTAVNKLIVLGLSLFEGAFESQFFAGYERILNHSWRKRNDELRSIDYEDLIPLMSFFQTDGKSIRGRLKDQRRKIIQLAWRTHKRWLVSAIPVLANIVLESIPDVFTDWDMFGSPGYSDRIREVIGDTFSDIGLQSFEDIENTLLRLAAHPSLYAQIVAAKAMSKWRASGEDRIYPVLERWLENQMVRSVMETFLQANEGRTADVTAPAHLQGTVALTLFWTAQYEINGRLSPKIKDLLVRLLPNSNKLIVERMQYTLDWITSTHPDSMADLLKEKFLSYASFINPAASGLAGAYNNGFSANVRSILQDWMAYYDGIDPKALDREKYTHRDKILSAVILTLKNIDYSKEEKAITLKEAYELLEKYRRISHNRIVRELLLVTMIDLIELNFYANERISIDLISNIDRDEREYTVKEFTKKYMLQRSNLTGGNYTIRLDDHEFETWSDPAERPVTPIEELLRKWEKSEHNVLSHIALQSFVEFGRIETGESRLVRDYLDKRTDKEKEEEKKKRELERKGAPEYRGELSMTEESVCFTKLCSRLVGPEKQQLLCNMAIVVLKDNLTDEEVEKIFRHLSDDDQASGDQAVKDVMFVYRLFRGRPFNSYENPLRHDPWSNTFVILSYLFVPVEKQKLLSALAPFLMGIPGLNSTDSRILLHKIKGYRTRPLRFFYTLCRNPWLFFVFVFALMFLVFRVARLFG